MALPFWIENAFFRISDFLSEKLPRPEPTPEKFINARLISHDPDCRRLFKENARIGELSFKTLKSRFPMIPHLADVIQRYGGKLHVMAEINRGITWLFSDRATEIRKFMPDLTKPPKLIEAHGCRQAKVSRQVRSS